MIGGRATLGIEMQISFSRPECGCLHDKAFLSKHELDDFCVGEKKRQRQESIAAKRELRAQRRGFDLQSINCVQPLS